MQVTVVDTETTGLSDRDQICELATVTLDSETRTVTRWSAHLIRPTCPVSPEARAVHHLTDAELADAPTLAEHLRARGRDALGGGDALAAHNLPFDLRMLLQSGVPEDWLPTRRLCTLRAARHVFPDSPRHSNQVLRYHLDLEPPRTDLPPHAALHDALVTAALLARMLETHTAEDLLAMQTRVPLQLRVEMGKNRGRLWRDMDQGFLCWVLARDFQEEVHATARHWLEKRRSA